MNCQYLVTSSCCGVVDLGFFAKDITKFIVPDHFGLSSGQCIVPEADLHGVGAIYLVLVVKSDAVFLPDSKCIFGVYSQASL